MKKPAHNISESSLGIEHFLREMGQFYEAECSMIKQEQINPTQRRFGGLPGIAADLLLDGFPLELIDGDASNIPMQWITDVLTELDTKTGERCRMRVISVLGVQSSGKSTLLNTMFGLQFPVACGKCTRGAFMTLIRVEEDFIEELGCDFILVIDTEGLKAPELTSLEDSYEHDNELATLVIGLSDITIINMAMENTAKMKDALQTVVHAFLRMSELVTKPRIYFVYQDVSNVTFEKNEASRGKPMKELNDKTKLAAKMQKINKAMEFFDIIYYDSETHSCYIPRLWQGVPPMAQINQEYSENVWKLKKCLFGFMKDNNSPSPRNVKSFIERMKSLWNAVKQEMFVFSFQNFQSEKAYDQLSMKYSELEWQVRKQVNSCLVRSENIIKNQLADKIQSVTSNILEHDVRSLLDKEETNMVEQLTEYFQCSCANAHLLEEHREEFLIHVKSLRRDLEILASGKCWEVVRTQKRKWEIENKLDKSQEFTEDNLMKYLENHKLVQKVLSETELSLVFDTVWSNILKELNMIRLPKHRVDTEMLEQLKQEMRSRPILVTETLNNVKSLKDYEEASFKVSHVFVDNVFLKNVMEFVTKDFYKKLGQVAQLLAEECQDYVRDKVTTKEDYDELYCQELLTIINRKLDEEKVRKLHPSPLFEVELKLHILGRAAPHFQKMHDDYGLNNDPKLVLQNLKPQYFLVFKSTFQHQDNVRCHAKRFCERCLKPAVTEHIFKNLGQEIVDEILQSPDGSKFKNRKHFQFTLLKELLEINRFENYLQYITQYETYVRRWITEYITKKCSRRLKYFLSGILSSITGNIKAVLRHEKVQTSESVSVLLQMMSMELREYLVLSKSAMKVSEFQNTSNIHQFSADIEYFLDAMEVEIKRDVESMDVESILWNLTLKPHDELFQRVIGCGKKCPFCEVPCETRGTKHYNHSVTIHRPKGLAQYTWAESHVLCNSTCSTDILSNSSFINPDTDGKWHTYKEYQIIYPDWNIQPDKDLKSSDYWKFVLTQFNQRFAEHYNANPTEIPPEWEKITQQHALRSLWETYSVKE